MTTETTPQVLSEEQLAYAIGSLRIFADTFKDSTDSDPCYDIDKLEAHIDTLTAERDQQAWDMRSLEATIETLRGEVGRLREALEWYADKANWDDTDCPGRGVPGNEVQVNHPLDPEEWDWIPDNGTCARAVLARMEGGVVTPPKRTPSPCYPRQGLSCTLFLCTPRASSRDRA